MKKRKFVKIVYPVLILLGLYVSLIVFVSPIFAQACQDISCNKDTQGDDDYLKCIKEKQNCWEGEINKAREQRITLANTISILENQIFLQELQIEQTETEIRQLQKQITELKERLSGLEISLDQLSSFLVKRIQTDYKRRRSPSLNFILLSDSVSQLLSHIKYLEETETHLGKLMQQTEIKRLDYDKQKQLKEEREAEVKTKQIQLENQKAQLDQQKHDQELLLVQTKHDEARFQNELAKTLAELEAIQSIIAGKGDETRVSEIKEGDSIASIISGASVCSTGTHLHFEVAKDGAHRNPADYLRNIDVVWNNQPDSPFSFNGSWNWPVNDAAKITQGYGMTWYATVKRAYGGAAHTGIDMVSKSYGNYTVKAVKDGTLYRGSIPCGGGLLRYVKVEHKDGGENSYYLHVNY